MTTRITASGLLTSNPERQDDGTVRVKMVADGVAVSLTARGVLADALMGLRPGDEVCHASQVNLCAVTNPDGSLRLGFGLAVEGIERE